MPIVAVGSSKKRPASVTHRGRRYEAACSGWTLASVGRWRLMDSLLSWTRASIVVRVYGESPSAPYFFCA